MSQYLDLLRVLIVDGRSGGRPGCVGEQHRSPGNHVPVRDADTERLYRRTGRLPWKRINKRLVGCHNNLLVLCFQEFFFQLFFQFFQFIKLKIFFKDQQINHQICLNQDRICLAINYQLVKEPPPPPTYFTF